MKKKRKRQEDMTEVRIGMDGIAGLEIRGREKGGKEMEEGGNGVDRWRNRRRVGKGDKDRENSSSGHIQTTVAENTHDWSKIYSPDLIL